MFYLSPLEGVKSEIFLVINFWFTDVSFTSFVFFLLFIYSNVFLLFYFLTEHLNVIPLPGQLFIEYFYKFVLDMVIGRTGPQGLVYFPLIFCIFVFILFANLSGLVPFGVTVTAQVGLTFMLGYSVFIGLTILGFMIYQHKFFKKFIIGGELALPLVMLLFVLEIVSYCVRPLSLSVRLAANMIGGHALLHLLSMMFIKFVSSLFGAKGSWSMFICILNTVFFIIGLFAVMLLELGVGFLQAYIFSLLTCLYLGEVLQPIR